MLIIVRRNCHSTHQSSELKHFNNTSPQLLFNNVLVNSATDDYKKTILKHNTNYIKTHTQNNVTENITDVLRPESVVKLRKSN